jgi:putative ABC transport system substrate-binding protein
MKSLDAVLSVVSHHHEKRDGSGSPTSFEPQTDRGDHRGAVGGAQRRVDGRRDPQRRCKHRASPRQPFGGGVGADGEEHTLMPRNRHRRVVTRLLLTALVLAACGRAAVPKTHTIGVVNYDAILTPVLDGFKAKMAALGYAEGQSVTYVYQGVLRPDPQLIEREVERLKNQRVDLLLTLGTQPTLAAKKATAGTTIPVVFAPVLDPVAIGVVASITRPGGNLTGVRNGGTIPKSLEWLHKVAPRAGTIYAIYHPKDAVAQTATRNLSTLAPPMGIDLVLVEARSPEEAIAAIERLPKAAAIFFVPVPSLEPLAPLVHAASRRGIATGANLHRSPETGVLVTYAADWFSMGQQAARLADQILKGAKPADLPVETGEHSLRIDLKTATAIGLDISDEILRQADLVIR